MIDNRNTNIFLGGVASYSGVYAGKEKNIGSKKKDIVFILLSNHSCLIYITKYVRVFWLVSCVFEHASQSIITSSGHIFYIHIFTISISYIAFLGEGSPSVKGRSFW